MAKRRVAVGRIITYDGSEPGTLPCREIEYRVPFWGNSISVRETISMKEHLLFPLATGLKMDQITESILRIP